MLDRLHKYTQKVCLYVSVLESSDMWRTKLQFFESDCNLNILGYMAQKIKISQDRHMVQQVILQTTHPIFFSYMISKKIKLIFVC